MPTPGRRRFAPGPSGDFQCLALAAVLGLILVEYILDRRHVRGMHRVDRRLAEKERINNVRVGGDRVSSAPWWAPPLLLVPEWASPSPP